MMWQAAQVLIQVAMLNSPALDHLGEISAGCGNEANIYGDGPIPAQPRNLPLL